MFFLSIAMNLSKGFTRPLIAAWLHHNKRSRAERELRTLDDHMLADIGLQRADVDKIIRYYRQNHRADWARAAEISSRETPVKKLSRLGLSGNNLLRRHS